VKARALVEVQRRGGRDVAVALRSEPPLTLRATVDGVRLVGSGAGPLGGDDLALDVRAGPGASLDLSSVAASLVQPGPTGLASRTVTDVEVAEGARLHLHLQPSVLVGGCDHESFVGLRLGAGASLVWRDEIVLGRHDEPSGSLRQRVDVEVDGVALLRTEVGLGPAHGSSSGPAGIGPARAVGSLLIVDESLDVAAVEAVVLGDGVVEPYGGVVVAPLVLDGPGVLVSAVGDGPSAVADALDAVVGALTAGPLAALARTIRG
jgi:urease accessory protein